MTGFELRTSGIGSKCPTNWATTTAMKIYILYFSIFFKSSLNRLMQMKDTDLNIAVKSVDHGDKEVRT